MPEIFIGSDPGLEDGELIEFLNLAFGFEEGKSFLDMYPGLYKAKYRPTEHNLVVREDGRLVAAVGLYPRTLSVGGAELSTCGIGNVAVHPGYRSKGYMKKLMQLAMDGMKEKYDFSDLGGQRQRYQNYGFEIVAAPLRFRYTRKTVDHLFRGNPGCGGNPGRSVRFADPSPYYGEMFALYESKKCRMLRSRDAFEDILRSHFMQPVAIVEDGKFLGYFTGDLNELSLVNPADLPEVVKAALGEGTATPGNFTPGKFIPGDYTTGERKELSFAVAPWDLELIKVAEATAEEVFSQNRLKCCIFNWEKVLGTFLKFQAEYRTLTPGRFTVLIHGYNGDECLSLSVSGDGTKVEKAEPGEAVFELSATEAVSFFFGLYSSKRLGVPEATAWLPLPLYFERTDNV